MFIDITPILQLSNMKQYVSNDSNYSWPKALDLTSTITLLVSSEQLQEYKRIIADYGGWSREEIAAFTDQELQALCIQDVICNLLDNSDRLDGEQMYMGN